MSSHAVGVHLDSVGLSLHYCSKGKDRRKTQILIICSLKKKKRSGSFHQRNSFKQCPAVQMLASVNFYCHFKGTCNILS